MFRYQLFYKRTDIHKQKYKRYKRYANSIEGFTEGKPQFIQLKAVKMMFNNDSCIKEIKQIDKPTFFVVFVLFYLETLWMNSHSHTHTHTFAFS